MILFLKKIWTAVARPHEKIPKIEVLIFFLLLRSMQRIHLYPNTLRGPSCVAYKIIRPIVFPNAQGKIFKLPANGEKCPLMLQFPNNKSSGVGDFNIGS